MKKMLDTLERWPLRRKLIAGFVTLLLLHRTVFGTAPTYYRSRR